MLEAFSPTQAVEVFWSFDPTRRTDVADIIRSFDVWKNGLFSVRQLQDVPWYLDDNPQHVSRFLTSEGQRRSLRNVARRYRESEEALAQRFPDFIGQIEAICNKVKQGEKLPPLIIAKGRNPLKAWWLLDGVHRGLAYCVSLARGDVDEKYEISVMMGRRKLF